MKSLGANQTQITVGLVDILVSYQTPVAMYDHGSNTAYKTERKWSKTTSKHINAWFDLNKDVKEVPQSFFDDLLRTANETGSPCFCRVGIERDNCSRCEGTGMQINFEAIRRAK